MNQVESVYQRVLGARFGELDPQLQRYFGPFTPGQVGRGSGHYEVAGLRLRVLRPVFAMLAWRSILFPEFAQDVPFEVTNTPTREVLNGERLFHLPGRTRRMVDAMSVVNGHLVDRLGKRGGLEATFALAIDRGALTMTSTRMRVRLAGVWITAPPVTTMTVHERAGDAPGTQYVDARLRVKLLGEIFCYRGSFTYEVSNR